MLALPSLACAIGMATQVLAHDDAPHSTGKKGYVLNDAHKCVKAMKIARLKMSSCGSQTLDLDRLLSAGQEVWRD